MQISCQLAHDSKKNLLAPQSNFKVDFGQISNEVLPSFVPMYLHVGMHFILSVQQQ